MRRLRVFLNDSSGVETLSKNQDMPALAGNHVPALDGLRGLAILLVMLNHFTLYGGMRSAATIDKIFHKLAVSGWVGVDLFLVLSGFLITGILYDTKTSTHFFRNFYARRFVRIFPLYYGTLFFFFIILPHVASLGKEFQSLIEQQSWYWSYLINLRIALLDWSPFGIIDHFWSLAVEEQFYLVWPIFVFLFSRRRLMTICGVCVIASLSVRVGLVLAGYPTAANVLTFARMDSLAVGAFLALAARGSNGLARLHYWALPIAALALAALIGIFVWKQGLNSDDRVMQTIGYTLLAALFGAILTLAVTQAPRSAFGRAFASPFLQFFGRYSYALYVFHQPIVFYLKEHTVSVEIFPRIMGLQLPGQLLFILIATGLSLTFALLSWYLYEHPLLKLKRLFPYEYEKKTSNKFEMPVGRSLTL